MCTHTEACVYMSMHIQYTGIQLFACLHAQHNPANLFYRVHILKEPLMHSTELLGLKSPCAMKSLDITVCVLSLFAPVLHNTQAHNTLFANMRAVCLSNLLRSLTKNC